MTTLAQFQDDNRSFQLMQNSWASALNPVINNPLNNCNVLSGIKLLAASNPNVVNHKLGRTLQGWFIVGQNASAIIYDAQSTNQSPNLTLNLKTSADVTINIAVF